MRTFLFRKLSNVLPVSWAVKLAGFVSLVWFFVRVIPKPSRAAYPCQQAAFPLATAFVISLMGGTVALVDVVRRNCGVFAAVALGMGGLWFGAQLLSQAEQAAPAAQAQPAWTPPEPNKPVGTGRGIFPGRVTWIRDVRATPWDGTTGHWWDEANIDQNVLNRMVSKSLQGLTGSTSDGDAWMRLFSSFNKAHARGYRGYQAGEGIAVKINLNNATGYADADNNIDQSTQSVRALLQQLTGPAGVPQKCITIYDASPNGKRRAIVDRIYVPLHAEFPEVHWVDWHGVNGREAPEWVKGAISYSSPETALGDVLPKCVVDAAYLINFALLKGHEMAGVTLCGKNHFGSIMFPFKDHPKYITPMKRELSAQSGLVDLMGCPNLGGKTVLYILDGLYGTQTNVGDVTQRDRWKRLFNGEWSASYFMSQDPVAIDSVGLDFLSAEFQGDLGFSGSKSSPKGVIKNCDNYLIEAANGSNAEFGPYKPNGNPCGSLGVHEHWNNARDKCYSRNLNPEANGIELVKVPAG